MRFAMASGSLSVVSIGAMSEPVSTISKESRAAIDTRFEKDSPHVWLRYSQGHREHEPMGIPIGRELYTAPRIWVYAQGRDGSTICNVRQGQNGKFQCYDSFSVERIDIANHEILYVSIRNDTTGQTVFAWAKETNQTQEATDPDSAPSREQLEEISGLVDQLAKSRGATSDAVIHGLVNSKAVLAAGVENGEIMTARQASVAIGQLRAWMRNGEANA